ncbi:MAG: hypothetical protein ACK5HY_16200 [Parahaliea sp.]
MRKVRTTPSPANAVKRKKAAKYAEKVELLLSPQQADTVRDIGVDFLVDEVLTPLLNMLAEDGARYSSARRALPEAEAAALRAVGADIDYPARETQAAFARGSAWLRVRWQQLVASSLSRLEVAQRLGVTAPRVSQLLQRQALYAIAHESKHRFPAFQFTANGELLPGLARVLPHLREGVHPVLVQTLFTTATPDLLIGGEPATPIEWLCSGHSPDELIPLARAI